MARLTNTTIYGAANVTGNVVTTGFAFDISANNGVNISNANTISSVVMLNNGSQYLSVPSIVFSAPTTGGATANANAVLRFSGTIQAGNVGSGYANGDILYANVAGSLQNAWFTVTSNTATTYGTGGINGISVGSYGQYFVIPPGSGAVNPYITITGTTSATGVGANLQSFSGMAINNVYFQTTGSGYVEQPTVTFTGGSPSTAATGYVYLNSTIQNIRLLGQQTNFYQGYQSTPAFQITDGANGNGGVSGGYWQITNAGSGGQLFSINTPSGIAYIGTGSGSASVGFRTNFNYDQFRISHTQSSVNYVNVTGATTTNAPIISAQGSDANVAINLLPKGSAAVMITGNTSGYIAQNNSIYVSNRMGFANSNNISVVYQTWNTVTNSLDVVYG